MNARIEELLWSAMLIVLVVAAVIMLTARN